MDAGRELDALIAKIMGREVDADWTPSTDITAAWPVAEKYSLWVFPYEGQWCAGTEIPGEKPYMAVDDFDTVIDGHLNYCRLANTAPLAICRAALAALRTE